MLKATKPKHSPKGVPLAQTHCTPITSAHRISNWFETKLESTAVQSCGTTNRCADRSGRQTENNSEPV